MSATDFQQAIELAAQHDRTGRRNLAEGVYRQLLAAHANQPDALVHLGLLTAETARPGLAVGCFNRALQLRPNDAIALCHLALALNDCGRHEQAIETYRQAMKVDPTIAQAWSNLGALLSAASQAEEAADAFARAMALRPDLALIPFNFGVSLREAGRAGQAIAAFQQAVRIQPDYIDAWNRLGEAHQACGQLEQAIAACRKAIEIDPNSAAAHNNLASALHASGQYPSAVESYRCALSLRPDWPLARYNLGLTLLLLGEFEQGWPLHEARCQATEIASRPQDFPRPQWDGAELNGRRILLHCEQGIGDSIQFIRYLPSVAGRGGKIILQCQPELHRLFQTLPDVWKLIDTTSPVPEFDVHCPMMSLAGVFKSTLDSIPAPVPYLRADPVLVERWRSRMAHDGRLKMGLAWSGRAAHANDRTRSIALREFDELAKLAQVQWFSLQKGAAAAQAASMPWLTDLTTDLHSFADTAALIENLDLVLTVDTAVAHLAGAMGKPVWTLLPFVPDWRWLQDRADSPWYPTMRLFRRKTKGDWPSVINEVVRMLTDLPVNPRRNLLFERMLHQARSSVASFLQIRIR